VCVCVCVYPPLSTFEFQNQSLWSLVCTSFHQSYLNGVLRKSLPSACVALLFPLFNYYVTVR
jgi:hypothetical protein